MPPLGEALARLGTAASDRLFRGGVVSQGPASSRAVALSFDDGPDPEVTPRIAGILEKRGVPATFFMVGELVRRNPVLARQIAERFEFGGHLFSHTRRVPFTAERFEEELQRSQALFHRVMGREAVLLRFPWGERGVIKVRDLRRRGLQVIHWTVSSGDERLADPQAVVRRTLRGARPGAILRFHDGWARPGPDPVSREVTVAALPAILDGLEARNLACLTVGSLLR